MHRPSPLKKKTVLIVFYAPLFPPLHWRRRIRNGKSYGVSISDVGTKGWLENCDIEGNKEANLAIGLCAYPSVMSYK